jgi:7,8-dihydroneopterin aldolase/epimerase/oxygenase
VPSFTPGRLEITLAGMRFHARVGVLPHERDIPQPIEIDLTVRRRDESTELIDYRVLYAIARDAVAEEPVEYLESLAEVIVAAVSALDGVAGVRVAVRKPHVALGGPLAHAEIVLERGA